MAMHEILVDLLADQVAEFFEARHVADVVESEVHEKFARGAIQKRTADDVLASGDADHAPLQQRANGLIRIHAADLRNLRRRNRLAIRDDGQRLQRGDGEAVLAFFRKVLLQNRIVLGARGQAPAARGLFEHESAEVIVERALDLFELRDDRFPPLVRKRLGKLVELHRLVADEEDGLEGRCVIRLVPSVHPVLDTDGAGSRPQLSNTANCRLRSISLFGLRRSGSRRRCRSA